MSVLIHAPSKGQMLGAIAARKRRTEFGVGGGGGRCAVAPRSGGTDPRCYDINYLMCCKQITSDSVLTVAAATAWTIQVEPQNSPYFKPCAIAMMVADSADPGLKRLARITGASVRDCPVWTINTPTPVVGTTAFFTSVLFDPEARDGCGCPFDGPTFSNLALTAPFRIFGFNDNALPIDITVMLWGDECGIAPDCGCGNDKAKVLPPIFGPAPTVTTSNANGRVG